jgi:lipopolysaccharide export system permease protein
MVKIDNHIRNTVLLAMLVVVSLIISVDLVFALAEEISDTNENYSLINALSFIGLTLPTSIYELLPFIALGGALIGLGILASNNELIVLQAAGVSVWRIVWSVLKPTMLIMLLSLLLGEFIAPPLEQLAQSNKAVQQSGNDSIASDQGTWRKVGNEYIHINAIAPGVVDTDLIRSVHDAETRKKIKGFIPQNRFADASEIADLVLFLASNRARHICGEVVNINGGLCMD